MVDGVLGIGGRPGLPDDVAVLARDLAGTPIPIVAVDLPSGVGADTGAVPGEAFWATQTVTFGERKPCHLLEPARQRCGEVEVVDIGLGSIPSGTSRSLAAAVGGRGPGWPAGPTRMRAATSTPAAWSASTPARTTTPARRS